MQPENKTSKIIPLFQKGITLLLFGELITTIGYANLVRDGAISYGSAATATSCSRTRTWGSASASAAGAVHGFRPNATDGLIGSWNEAHVYLNDKKK